MTKVKTVKNSQHLGELHDICQGRSQLKPSIQQFERALFWPRGMSEASRMFDHSTDHIHSARYALGILKEAISFVSSFQKQLKGFLASDELPNGYDRALLYRYVSENSKQLERLYFTCDLLKTTINRTSAFNYRPELHRTAMKRMMKNPKISGNIEIVRGVVNIDTKDATVSMYFLETLKGFVLFGDPNARIEKDGRVLYKPPSCVDHFQALQRQAAWMAILEVWEKVAKQYAAREMEQKLRHSTINLGYHWGSRRKYILRFITNTN